MRRIPREIRTCIRLGCSITFEVVPRSSKRCCSVRCSNKVKAITRAKPKSNSGWFKKDRKPWNYGLTTETDPRVAKYGKSGSETKKKKPYQVGEDNPFYGRHHSEESKQKFRKTVESRGGRKQENNANWRGGISISPYASNWTEMLRESIRERDNRICQLCGKTEEEEIIGNGCGLSVHHVDYDKQNCNEDNLITLCNSCHSTTNCRREFWTEFFRVKLGLIIVV